MMKVKYVSKKISAVRWIPKNTSEFVTGSWDDHRNEVCVWKFPTASMDVDPIKLKVGDPLVVSQMKFPGSVTDLKVTLNSDLIFATSTKGSLVIYKYVDEKLHLLHSFTDAHKFPNGYCAPATSVSVKGNDVATSGEDGQLCIFNFNKLQKVRQIGSSDLCSISSISYLRHQEIAAGNILGYLKTWDLRSRNDEPSHTLMIPGERVGVSSMVPHPVQPHILATGHEDGTLCIWDLRADRKPPILLAGHKAGILDIVFHPVNPNYLYTCSMDGGVWQWNASALAGSEGQDHPTDGFSWLNCDAGKHRLDITSFFPNNRIPVNSLDLSGSTLLWGTDNEALYIYPDLNI